MNLECHVCAARNVATSFQSLDDLQYHLFCNHEAPLNMFMFVCHKCNFKFGNKQRLSEHEETCGGRELRSAEYMTGNQTTSVPPANPSNIETPGTRNGTQSQSQTESLGTKRIKVELPKTLENPVSNLWTAKAKVQDQNRYATKTHSNVKSESQDVDTSEVEILGTVEIRRNKNCTATDTHSNVKFESQDMDTSEVEILGTVEIKKRKALSISAEHTSHRSGEIAQQNVNSKGESSNMQQMNEAITSLGTSNTQPRTIDGIPLWKQYLLGLENVDQTQISGCNITSDQDERIATLISTAANLTDKIIVSGPCLHPKKKKKYYTLKDSELYHRDNIRTYFNQFGRIFYVCVQILDDLTTNSYVIFDQCVSAAKCIEQGNHKILGQNFRVQKGRPSKNMSSIIIGNLEQNLLHSPAILTNRIFVSGPCLHPLNENPNAFQRKAFRTYFSQFGKILNIELKEENILDFSVENVVDSIIFDSRGSAAKCLQQHKHRIRGHIFTVWAAEPILKNIIFVKGPCLDHEKMNPNASLEGEFRTYFSQFGKVNGISMITAQNAQIAFDDCDSAAKCLQQEQHQIGAHDFIAWTVSLSRPTNSMKNKIRAPPEPSMPVPMNENVSDANTICISGPCLHPEEMDPIASQRDEFRTYFSQFGQITDISIKTAQNAKIAFDNSDSVAKCIQQDKHTIGVHDFIVWPAKPTTSMREKIKENLVRSMNWPPNVKIVPTRANVQSNPPTASNLESQMARRRQMLQASSQVHRDYLHLNLTKADRKKIRACLELSMRESSNVNTGPTVANVQSNPPTASNLGSQMSLALASTSSQVHGSVEDCSEKYREWSQSIRWSQRFDELS
ncbi:hypothetical protein Ddc_10147 [Ditylenchus destructor]|nr:hypothetical protein Ddc_10147 [Ditylenchus destructor]